MLSLTESVDDFVKYDLSHRDGGRVERERRSVNADFWARSVMIECHHGGSPYIVDETNVDAFRFLQAKGLFRLSPRSFDVDRLEPNLVKIISELVARKTKATKPKSLSANVATTAAVFLPGNSFTSQ